MLQTPTTSTLLTPQEVERFATQGYVGPKALLTGAQCALLMRYLRHGRHPAPPDWPKARGVVEPLLLDVSTSPPLLAWLGQLLGSDIVLWGVSVVERAPGQPHPWHTDIETSSPDARTAAAWIGLEHVSRHSVPRFVGGSHRFGKPIQQVAHERGMRRAELSEATALALAQELDATSEIIAPEATAGDALLFDGRIWHGSLNGDDQIRTALLVQFADARTAIRLPDFSTLEWPFRFHAQPRPPCISVAGLASHDANRVVPSPAEEAGVSLAPQFKKLSLPLEQEPTRGWRPYPQFKGATPVLNEIACHVSVLSAGCCPHAPHKHVEEEVLLVLDGEAELVIPSGPDDAAPRIEPVQPGSFVYYPAFQLHTLRNHTQSPVSYLMFKWRSAPDETGEPLSTQLVRLPPVAGGGASFSTASFSTRVLFDGPTAFLRRLHAHLSELRPGGGYASHVDAHDVAIVVLSGRIETNGHRVGRHGVVHFPAGEPHDMRNTTQELARYLVFEFHSPRLSAERPRSSRARRPVARRVSASARAVVERLRYGAHRVARKLRVQAR